MKLASNLIMSVTQAAIALAESERIGVSLEASRCLHSLDKTSGCAICVDACPVDAIAFEDGEERKLVTHDAETCVKCGLCLRICPVEAFTGDNGVPDLLTFVARQEKRGIVELGCALHPNKKEGPPQADLVVNTGACLAALGPSAVMALMALGVAHVILRVDFCQACPLAQSRAEIDKTVDQVESLLEMDEGSGSPVTLLDTVRDDWPARPVAAAKAPPKTRRDFFQSLVAPPEVPANVRQLIVVEPSARQKYPPLERRRLLQALRSFPQDLPSRRPLEAFHLSTMAVDENCTACGVCERACPTGAIGFTVDEDHYQVSFTAGACTDCDVCISLCEPGAMHRGRSPTLNDWLAEEALVLRSGELKHCQKCGAGFDSKAKSGFCPVCEFRQKNLFGSQLPKGFKRQNQPPKRDDIRH